MQTTITDARRDFTRLLRRAERGEVVLLTRHGHPIVEVRVVPKPSQTDDQRLTAAITNIVAPSYLTRFFNP